MVLRNIVNTNFSRQNRNELNVKRMTNRRKLSNVSFALERAISLATDDFAEENATFEQGSVAQVNVAQAILNGDVAGVTVLHREHVVVGNVLHIHDCRSRVVVVTLPCKVKCLSVLYNKYKQDLNNGRLLRMHFCYSIQIQWGSNYKIFLVFKMVESSPILKWFPFR